MGILNVANVELQFSSLTYWGDRFAIRPKPVIRWPRYTASGDNASGVDNHFQGIQRLGSGRVGALSGSDPNEPSSRLFFFSLGSRSGPSAWGSNLLGSDVPPTADALTGSYAIDASWWHAGGMSLFGTTLAVPLEKTDPPSRVIFLDVADPQNPKKLRPEIARPGWQGGAVALTQLENGDSLLAVLSDSDPHGAKQHLDLYGAQGPPNGALQWTLLCSLVDQVQTWPGFQTIEFVTDQQTKQLYLMGFENDSMAAPTFKGSNIGLLCAVDLPTPLNAGMNPAMVGIRSRVQSAFRIDGKFFNMAAATGIYLGPNGRLCVHSAYHYISAIDDPDRRSGAPSDEPFIQGSEFRSTTGWNGSIGNLADAVLELYEDANLQGRHLTLCGTAEASAPDHGELWAGGDDCDRMASSVLYQLPEGHAYLLFREKSAQGSSILGLKGTGQRESIPHLDRFGFDKAVRSSECLDLSAAQAKQGVTWFPQAP